MFTAKTFGFVLLFSTTAHAAVVEYTWDIRDWTVDFLRPTTTTEKLCDGEPWNPVNPCGGTFSETARELPFNVDWDKMKSAQLVNGLYPGPMIAADEGDTIRVTVINNLRSSSTTIHWHGLHQRGTPWEDGPLGVTQGPIVPNTNYTYEFEAYPAGTYFYHSHLDGIQQSKGIKGPIVIQAREDPFEALYDEELVVMLSDEWRNPEACFTLAGAMPGNPVCSDAVYVSFNGQWGDGSYKYPYPLLRVQQGKRYRIRFVNTGGNIENLLVSIAGHSMLLIALDGQDVKPIDVKTFNIHNGERVDVILNADQPAGYYRIEMAYDYGCSLLEGHSFPVPGFGPVKACKWYAFLGYQSKSFPPVPLPKQVNMFYPDYEVPNGTGGGAKPKKVEGPVFDTTYRYAWTLTEPLVPVEEPDEPDLRLVVNMGLHGPTNVTATDPYGSKGQWYSDVEGRQWTWSDPDTPLLHTKGQCGADKTPFFTIPENVTTVEVVINNLSPTAHIMHMHGGNFRVVNYANFDWCYLNKTACFVMPDNLNPCPAEDRENGDPDHPWLSVPDFRKKFGPTLVKTPWIKAPLYWGCKYNARTDKKSEMLKAPLRKDTVPVWQRSWAVIRFTADNPGMWLFHCHLQPHIPLGMLMTFNVKPDEQPPVPAKAITTGECPVWSWADKYDADAEALKAKAERVRKLYPPHSK